VESGFLQAAVHYWLTAVPSAGTARGNASTDQSFSNGRTCSFWHARLGRSLHPCSNPNSAKHPRTLAHGSLAASGQQRVTAHQSMRWRMMVDDGIVQVKPFLACHVTAHICRFCILQARNVSSVGLTTCTSCTTLSYLSYLREISRSDRSGCDMVCCGGVAPVGVGRGACRCHPVRVPSCSRCVTTRVKKEA
jgi:hypothetical protein